MSVRDPRDDADDIDRRFEQLVAGWHEDASAAPSGRDRVDGDTPAVDRTAPSGTEPGGTRTPRTPPRRLPPAPVEPAAQERPPTRWANRTARARGGAAAPIPSWDPLDDDEPFEPPAAPPIPVRPGVAVGFALLAVAFLLAFMMLMGVDIGRTLGAIAGGLGVVGLVLLLLNVRRGPRDDSLDYDPRDGSRL